MRILFFLIAAVCFSRAAMAWSPSEITNPQGALWHLLETGRGGEAREYEQKLTDILQNSRPKNVYEISSGVSQSFLVEFEDNIFAIVKTRDPKYFESLNNEVAAYRVDRAMGLNMVPLTVVRKMNGLEVSVQLYYPQLPPGQFRVYDDFVKDYVDIEVFDRLVGNGDRNVMENHNVIRGEDHRMIAIDQARAFIDDTESETYNQLPSALADQVSAKIKKKISEINVDRFVAGLVDLLSPRQRQILRDKLKAMSESFQRENIEVSPVFIEPQKVSLEFPRPKTFINLRIAAKLENRKKEGAIKPIDLLKSMTAASHLRCAAVHE